MARYKDHANPTEVQVYRYRSLLSSYYTSTSSDCLCVYSQLFVCKKTSLLISNESISNIFSEIPNVLISPLIYDFEDLAPKINSCSDCMVDSPRRLDTHKLDELLVDCLHSNCLFQEFIPVSFC